MRLFCTYVISVRFYPNFLFFDFLEETVISMSPFINKIIKVDNILRSKILLVVLLLVLDRGSVPINAKMLTIIIK